MEKEQEIRLNATADSLLGNRSEETEKRKQRRRNVDKTEKQSKLNTEKTVKGTKQGEGRRLK